MKCPYQTIISHKSEYTEGYVKHFTEDIIVFYECVKNECPFYYTTEYKPARQILEHCRKAESEVSDDCGKPF